MNIKWKVYSEHIWVCVNIKQQKCQVFRISISTFFYHKGTEKNIQQKFYLVSLSKWQEIKFDVTCLFCANQTFFLAKHFYYCKETVTSFHLHFDRQISKNGSASKGSNEQNYCPDCYKVFSSKYVTIDIYDVTDTFDCCKQSLKLLWHPSSCSIWTKFKYIDRVRLKTSQ